MEIVLYCYAVTKLTDNYYNRKNMLPLQHIPVKKETHVDI